MLPCPCLFQAAAHHPRARIQASPPPRAVQSSPIPATMSTCQVPNSPSPKLDLIHGTCVPNPPCP
jgi:hypothetical protein